MTRVQHESEMTSFHSVFGEGSRRKHFNVAATQSHSIVCLRANSFLSPLLPDFLFQVYSSTEHLATPSNLSFSSDRSHSEDKEDRGDIGGLFLSPADGSVEHKHAGPMARLAQCKIYYVS